MNSVVRIVLIITIVLQFASPFSTISPTDTGQKSSASSALMAITNTAPILADQLKASNANNTNPSKVSLKIKATPQLVVPGETVTLDWSLSGWSKSKATTGLSLELNIPEGITAMGTVDSKTNAYGTTVTTPLSIDTGSLTLTVAKDAKLPIIIDVKLLSNGIRIDSNSVLLDQAHFRADSDKENTLVFRQGKVKVDIPASSISENLVMDIREPGPLNDRGYSLSGQPIEILAVGESTRENVNRFKNEITISVQYDPEQIFGWAEDDLSLFYFDESTQDWWPIPTTVNKETHELKAKVNHLTVFDYKANSWQGARTPTVDGAQVSSYTGAGTYNMSFWTPPAPGGFQPSISLSYNSQVIDNSTAFTQASWVGMGWSLDTGYIERNMHGTNSDLTDDTYSLFLNGTSTQLLPIEVNGTVTRYAAKDINYWTIENNSSTGNWTVWDQTGNRYEFNDQALTHTTNGCITSVGSLNLVWRWSLSSAIDKFGNTISYTYYKQPKAGSCVNQMAVYPDTISYPNGKYQIKFIRESRTDYQTAWEAADSKTFYSTQRLDKIQVQQNPSGSSWVTIRQFDFSYSAGTTNQIYPPFTWTKGMKTTTLVGVQELSGDGTSALPATTFSYADYMHLTQVNNGQGGKVTFAYERWQYLDDVNKDIRHIYTVFGESECVSSLGIGTLWYTMSGGYGLVKCEADMLQVDRRSNQVGVGLREFPQHMVKPGGQYRMVIRARNIYATTSVEWGFTDPFHSVDIEGSVTGVGSSFVEPEFAGEMPVLFDPNSTKLIIECDNCYVKKVNFALMQLYYRVTSKTIEDTVTSTTSTYTYNYDEPTANDSVHSAIVNKTSDLTKYYIPTMRDYRGNAMVLVKNPDGLVNTTWFYQNDLLSGSPYRTLTSSQDFYDSFDALDAANWSYSHQGTRQVLSLQDGDNSLSNSNPGSDWTSTLYKGYYTLNDGDVMFTQFKATGASVQNELGITNSNGDFFGMVMQPNGTQKVVQMRTTISGTTSDSTTLISGNDYKPGVWYMVMIFVDSNDGFHIRVWEKGNPQISGEGASSSLNGNNTWRLRQRTFNGTVYLDTYLEGIPYSETETQYSTSVLYDTDTTTTTIPNIVSTGLMNFVDLQVNRTYANSTISRFFDRDYSFTGTRTTYDYNTSDQGGTQYGNLTRKVESSWNGTQWVDYRASKTVFNPNSSAHLTVLPARSVAFDCANGCDFTNETGKTAESLILYDNASSASSAPTSGIPTAARTWVDGSDYSQVSNGFDSYGNQTSVTTYTGFGTATSSPNTGGSTTYTDYNDSNYHTYPTSLTNALNQVTQTAYNYVIGMPTSVIDSNTVTTSAQYDVFGRMVKVVAPGDSDSSPTLGITYHDTFIPFQVDLNQKVDTSASMRISRFYDGLGHLIQRQTVGAVVNNQQYNVVVDSQFDTLGRLVKETKPYILNYNANPTFPGQNLSQALTQTTYDLIGRPTSVTPPDGNVTTYTYNELHTQVTDAASNVTATLKDAWGRVVTVDAPTGPDLTYTYNSRDLLTLVQKGTGGTSTQTSITYNNAGQKTGMVDPDMGSWTYVYNALGSLTSQTDARSCGTSLTYDVLNRLTAKTFSGSGACGTTPSIAYTYDAGTNGKGHRTSMTDGSGSSTWTYDTRGRTLSEGKTISGNSFTTSWTYNSADQPVTMTYPDGEVLTYGYNSQGAQTTLTNNQNFTYLSGTKYDEAGRITELNLGSNNLLRKAFTFYTWSTSVNGGKLSNMTVTNSSSFTLQNLGYSYDSRGNITQINDGVDSETSAFSYDALSRLTAMAVTSGGNTVHSEAFAYNSANGNLSGKGPDQNNLLSYTYGTTQPHAVTGFKGNAYAYDINGNQTGRDLTTGEFTLTYDAENHLVNVAANQPFPTETLNWVPIPTQGVTNTPTVTPTATITTTPTQTQTPTATQAPVTAQVIGQCGPYTNASASVTIPADTTMIVVVEGGSNYTLPTTYTVGGQPLTLAVRRNAITSNVSIYYRSQPAVGTQTISLNGFAPGIGGAWGCYYLKGIDTSSPIRDYGYSGVIDLSAISTTRTTQANDLVIDVLGMRFGSSFINYDCAQSSGYKSLTNKTASGYKTAAGTSTNSCYSLDVNWASLASVAIKSAPQPTSTPTATLTSTVTVTATATQTPTVTNTPTMTATQTPTVTSTHTPTSTHTATLTPTSIPTETQTFTVTATQTETSIPTETTTVTETQTPTETLTPSDTPEQSLTPSETPTVTQTPTETPQPTNTLEVTETPTVTLTPTKTVTSTETPTATSTPTATATPAPQNGNAAYTYDGDGNMVKSVIGDITTYYVGSHYEKKIQGSNQIERKYYFAGSNRIAMRENGALTWLLSDNLGSTSTTAAADGSLLDTVKYTAFGEIRDGVTATDYRYTGQRNEFEIGLYYYVARYYDPYLNRWTQPDTIIPDPYNPQSYDRFAYVNNNPINFNDPTGHASSVENGPGCYDETCREISKEEAYQIFYDFRLRAFLPTSPEWFLFGGDVIGLGDLTKPIVDFSFALNETITGDPHASSDWSHHKETIPLMMSFYTGGVGDIGELGPGGMQEINGKIGSNGVNSEGLGSTGRNFPINLREQLAMEQVKSDPLKFGQPRPEVPMTDPRWLGSNGWMKWSSNINGIEIHFNFNSLNIKFDDFKFK